MYDYLCVSTMPWSVFGMLPLLNYRTVVFFFFNSSHSGDTFIVKVTNPFSNVKKYFCIAVVPGPITQCTCHGTQKFKVSKIIKLPQELVTLHTEVSLLLQCETNKQLPSPSDCKSCKVKVLSVFTVQTDLPIVATKTYDSRFGYALRGKTALLAILANCSSIKIILSLLFMVWKVFYSFQI